MQHGIRSSTMVLAESLVLMQAPNAFNAKGKAKEKTDWRKLIKESFDVAELVAAEAELRGHLQYIEK